MTEDCGTLSLMGPRARDVLAAVTDADVSNAAFPFGHVREIAIAGHTVRALRVTYVGELGWELHMPIAATGEVFDALMAAGEPHGIRPVGYRALEVAAAGKGLSRLGLRHHAQRHAVRGRARLGGEAQEEHRFPRPRGAARRSTARPLKKRFAGFTVDDPDIVLLGRETILRDGELVGYLTSGGYGYTVGKNHRLRLCAQRRRRVTTTSSASGDYELVVARWRRSQAQRSTSSRSTIPTERRG